MARYWLTIQKKFLILMLLTGLLPVVIGVGVTILGSRLAFEGAMGATLQTRATEIAARLGDQSSELMNELGGIVLRHGGKFAPVAHDVSEIQDVIGVAAYTPDGGFEVRVSEVSHSALGRRLRERQAYFAGYAVRTNVRPGGTLDDIRLAGSYPDEDVRLAIFIFPIPGGGLLFFFMEGDTLLSRIRSGAGQEIGGVHLYSRHGYTLTHAVVGDHVLLRADEFLAPARAATSGWFESRQREAARRQWHVIGYSVVPRLAGLPREERLSTPWMVMVDYDMENFIGPQSMLIWGTILTAVAWLSVLMGVSVSAARRIVGPVKRLREQAEAMSMGRLHTYARVDTHDEIQDLAEAFNSMSRKLRRSHSDLEERAEESRVRAEHINVINEITKAITQALDIDRMFEILRRDLPGAIQYDGLWITRTEASSKSLHVTHADPSRLLKPIQRGDVPLEFSFQGRAMREGVASRGEIGLANDSDIFESGIYQGLGFSSYLVAPLPSVGGMLGTITVVSRRSSAFGDEETAVLESVAGAVALGIELADLFERTRGFAAELERKVEERTRDLARANRKLIQTEKYAATGRLAANLAHEINNPLSIIKNYLKLVSQGLIDAGGGRRSTDPGVEHLQTINEEINRIARIVMQLLDLHRPPEQNVSPTDFNAMLGGIIELMEKDLAHEKIKATCELEPDLPMPLVGPDLLKQVFLNLIRNAQDSMPDGGELIVRTQSGNQYDGRREQRVVIVTITDTGCGIDPKHLRDIFDPFFTTKAPDKGTGLGLAVSYGIVQMYHGTIEPFSTLGEGTRMVVTIPVDPSAADAAEAGSEQMSDATSPPDVDNADDADNGERDPKESITKTKKKES